MSTAMADNGPTVPSNDVSNNPTSDASPPSVAVTNHNNAEKPAPRSPQHVLTHNQRGRIVSWMIDNAASAGDTKICSRTVRAWPQYFRGTMKANLQRASRYWKNRGTLVQKYDKTNKHTGATVTSSNVRGVKRVQMKVSVGRGRKKSPWVCVLYKELNEEFDRFRKSGVRFNRRLLVKLALKIVNGGHNAVIGTDVRDPLSGKYIKEHLSTRWVQNFMQSSNIVSRSQCGKLMVSPAKKELIERSVAFHLGVLARGFREKSLKEDLMMNADETHFVINLHNHKTLARRGEDEIKYADVVSGDEGMTMMVMINGGRDACIQPPMMIFKNDASSYPIRGIADDVAGVSYRTGPKGWMDSRVFAEWLNEDRAVPFVHGGEKRVFYIDNCSGHTLTQPARNALEKKHIELRYFPPNATGLVQPGDSHLIQKVKAAWRSMWDEKVLDLIEKNCWVDPRSGSGKLVNPGKKYFLRLAADAVKEVNNARHKKDGVLYARRAMIRCGMALNLNGQWEEKQLSKKLQLIIEKYRDNFQGDPVDFTKDLEGEATETDSEQEN